MKNRKSLWIICGLFILALGALTPAFMPASSVCLGGVPLLGDRHGKLGVACDGCHRENPPKQNSRPEVCIGCHGDAGKIAELTKKADPNPHQSPHFDTGDCTSCHHAHKTSEDQCGACHHFGFTVP